MLLFTLLPFVGTQAAESYELHICGTRVTSANAADVLGDGVFSYDNLTKTLTVSGNCSTSNYSIIENGIDGLTINVAADATLSSSGGQPLISCKAITTITGSGKLTLHSQYNMGIIVLNGAGLIINDINLEVSSYLSSIEGAPFFPDGDLIIRHSTIHATSSNDNAIYSFNDISLIDCNIIQPEGGKIEGGKIVSANGRDAREVTIKASDKYDLEICGTQVTSFNAADVLGDGVFSYDHEKMMLTVRGGCSTTTSTSIISHRINGLTINVAADATLTSNGAPITCPANTVITGSGKLTLRSETDCGIFVRSGATLTIMNLTLDVSGKWGISGFPSNEHLALVHANLHATGTEGAICDFADIMLEECELTQPEGGKVDGGKIVDEEGCVAKEVTTKAFDKYDLEICGTQVTSSNAADVLGDGVFSYNSRNTTLTISGDCSNTTSTFIISNAIDELIINVAADATLTSTGGVIFSNADIYITGSGKLTLRSETDCGIYVTRGCDLYIVEINLDVSGKWGIAGYPSGEHLFIYANLHATGTEGAICDFEDIELMYCDITQPEGGKVDSGQITDAEGNVAKEVTIEAIKVYLLSVCGTYVTEDNAADVLGDGVFAYDPESQVLTVKGDASGTSDYYIIDSEIDGLTINVVTDSKFEGDLYLFEDTKLTGTGKLTVESEGYCGIRVVDDAVLTIEDMTLDVSCVNKGIVGYPYKDDYLIIRNSNIHVTGASGAICNFVGITLDDSGISEPVGAKVDGGAIVDSDGNVATEVVIGDRTTAVKSIVAARQNAARYDLSGRRIGHDHKGFVIGKSKKFLVK